MNYKLLGKTGVMVSPLCFGTMSFGGIADEAMSKAMFNRCRDKGINFFDCANVYEKGRSEEILGKLIADCRDEVIITSKVYFKTGPDVNAGGSSRYHIVRAIEASLQRLRTDYIDLYFIHRFDEKTPIEETLHILDDLVRQGKVLYLGASNFAAWQVAKALGISSKMGWSRFECIQPMYNLVKRQAEVEILPMAASEKIGVISYSPLGGGLLSGKYLLQKPEVGRLLDNKMYQVRYGAEWMQEVVLNFNNLAREAGINPATLAVLWVAAHPAITAPIIGARNPDQLRQSLDALDHELTPELYQRLSDLTPAPPPATDRNEEKTDFNYGLR
ncbi:MAG: aldo/keto reductase [Saprospiraceae bacterium]|nr:aldo/keto reductase [Saprospiraceae bacterium]